MIIKMKTIKVVAKPVKPAGSSRPGRFRKDLNILALMSLFGSEIQFKVKTCRVWKTQQVVLLFACILIISCQQSYTPKPSTYYRIDFPEKEYQLYDSICPFTFEYPVYGTVMPDSRPTSEPCWMNINFPKYKGTIYLSYKVIDSDNTFDRYIEDDWNIIFKKIAQKADAVDDHLYDNPEENVYGMMYDIGGNAASQVQFYVTDSVRHWLRGSLYFYARPNRDSLAPVVSFFREDIMVLMESVRWKEENLKSNLKNTNRGIVK